MTVVVTPAIFCVSWITVRVSCPTPSLVLDCSSFFVPGFSGNRGLSIFFTKFAGSMLGLQAVVVAAACVAGTLPYVCLFEAFCAD
jgi:hypothetical protein